MDAQNVKVPFNFQVTRSYHNALVPEYLQPVEAGDKEADVPSPTTNEPDQGPGNTPPTLLDHLLGKEPGQECCRILNLSSRRRRRETEKGAKKDTKRDSKNCFKNWSWCGAEGSQGASFGISGPKESDDAPEEFGHCLRGTGDVSGETETENALEAPANPPPNNNNNNNNNNSPNSSDLRLTQFARHSGHLSRFTPTDRSPSGSQRESLGQDEPFSQRGLLGLEGPSSQGRPSGQRRLSTDLLLMEQTIRPKRIRSLIIFPGDREWPRHPRELPIRQKLHIPPRRQSAPARLSGLGLAWYNQPAGEDSQPRVMRGVGSGSGSGSGPGPGSASNNGAGENSQPQVTPESGTGSGSKSVLDSASNQGQERTSSESLRLEQALRSMTSLIIYPRECSPDSDRGHQRDQEPLIPICTHSTPTHIPGSNSTSNQEAGENPQPQLTTASGSATSEGASDANQAPESTTSSLISNQEAYANPLPQEIISARSATLEGAADHARSNSTPRQRRGKEKATDQLQTAPDASQFRGSVYEVPSFTVSTLECVDDEEKEENDETASLGRVHQKTDFANGLLLCQEPDEKSGGLTGPISQPSIPSQIRPMTKRRHAALSGRYLDQRTLHPISEHKDQKRYFNDTVTDHIFSELLDKAYRSMMYLQATERGRERMRHLFNEMPGLETICDIARERGPRALHSYQAQRLEKFLHRCNALVYGPPQPGPAVDSEPGPSGNSQPGPSANSQPGSPKCSLRGPNGTFQTFPGGLNQSSPTEPPPYNIDPFSLPPPVFSLSIPQTLEQREASQAKGEPTKERKDGEVKGDVIRNSDVKEKKDIKNDKDGGEDENPQKIGMAL